MYNYNHLFYFYLTAKMGGVSKAANYLHISQPSLSSQLKVLETQLEKRLFEKRGRNLILTNEGERVFAYCKKMFTAAEEMQESLKSHTNTDVQKIRIGVSNQLERPFIADILSPLFKDKKITSQNTFFITSAKTVDLVTSLKNREIDLILTNKPIYGEDVVELAAISMPVNLLVSAENMRHLRIKFSRNTPIAEFIAAIPWNLVLPSESLKLRQETDIFFQEIRARKQVVFESDIISAVGRAILDGAGFGFLPVPYVHEEVKLNLISVFGPKQGYWKHMLYLVARRQDSYEPAIEHIRRCVKNVDKLV